MSDDELEFPDAQTERGDAPADAPVSAVDPQAHRKAKNRKKEAARQRAEFWHDVFSSEVGRREMWGILGTIAPSGIQMPVTPGGIPDERGAWMQLAVQLVRQEIFQCWWTHHPELVMLMRQENDPRHKTRGS